MSSAESSKGKEPIVIDLESNTLDEERYDVTGVLLRLKELFETGCSKMIRDINICVTYSERKFFTGVLEKKVLG